MRGRLPLFGAVPLLVGLALLAVVAIVTVDSLDKADGIRVEGVVVEANDNQKPIVEFRMREGQKSASKAVSALRRHHIASAKGSACSTIRPIPPKR